MSNEVEERFRTRQELYKARDKERRRIDRLASTIAITLEDYKYALRKFRGNLSKTAEYLGIERVVLQRKINTSPGLFLCIKQIDEEITDGVEEKLIDQAIEGVLPAVTFYLKTKAKDRGYTEKVETTTDPITLANSAAALIEAMKKGARVQLEDKNTIDAGEDSWQVEETQSHQSQS
jgi:hypothetical protein